MSGREQSLCSMWYFSPNLNKLDIVSVSNRPSGTELPSHRNGLVLLYISHGLLSSNCHSFPLLPHPLHIHSYPWETVLGCNFEIKRSCWLIRTECQGGRCMGLLAEGGLGWPQTEPKMCSIITHCFILFSAPPICLATQHNFINKKKRAQIYSQTELDLNSRSMFKNPFRLVLKYSCYRQKYRSLERLCDLHCACVCYIWRDFKNINSASHIKLSGCIFLESWVLFSLDWVICGYDLIPRKDLRGVFMCQDWSMAISGVPWNSVFIFAFGKDFDLV